MYKSKLQEYCQRKGWELPDYSTSRTGPDHIPRFTAVVNVHGEDFPTPHQCKSAKEAQNLAAKIAYDHFRGPQSASPSHAPLPLSHALPYQNHAPQSLPQAPLPLVQSPLALAHALPASSHVPHFSTDEPPSQAHARQTSALVAPFPAQSPPDVSHAPVQLQHSPVQAPVHVQYPPTEALQYAPPAQPQLFTIGAIMPYGYRVAPPPGPPPMPNFLQVAQTGLSTANMEVETVPPNIMQPNSKGHGETSMVHRSPIGTDDKISKDMLHIYKNRLQQYAQRKGLAFPAYTSEHEGPPHARRFKSNVLVEGKIFESMEFFSTLKEAEYAAAKVACDALSVAETKEDGGLCKNLLQELAQKKGLRFPSYQTIRSGPPHMPVFVSTVEVGSDTFEGAQASTKKQAEMNAAKVALSALTERAAKVSSSLEPAASADLGQTPAAADLGQNVQNVSMVKEKSTAADGAKGAAMVSSSLEPAASADLGQNVQNVSMVKEKSTAADGDAKIRSESPKYSSDNLNVDVTGLSQTNHNPSPGGSASLSAPAELPTASAFVAERTAGTSYKWQTVVMPRSSNRPIPEGATIMPYSDDKWVAYRVQLKQ